MTADPISIAWHDGCEPALADSILRALPDWFGIEEALVGYVKAAAALPTAVANRMGVEVGFASLERATDAACDVHVIAVRPDHHGTGIGHALIDALAARARAEGAHLLTVKTLSGRHPDPFYGRTRHFYEAKGFLPTAELPLHWGPDNPCLLMTKVL